MTLQGNGVDLPVDLPILALIVEIPNWHPWPLDNSTGVGGRSASWSANISSNIWNLKLTFFTTRCHGRVHLPVDLSILALIVEISNWHSSPLGVMGVDLPVDLPILALIVEISNCHSWPLDDSTGEWDRSASWYANISSNIWNLKLTFFTTRCHWG